MYLSRITLNHSLAQRHPGEYPLHQQVWRFFDPEQKGGNQRKFLYRRENEGRNLTIFTLSDEPPVVQEGWQVDIKEFSPPIQVGQRIRFKARLNPTVKDEAGKRRAVAAENLTEWLMLRLEKMGADLQTVAVENREVVFEKAQTGHEVTFGTVEVAGILTVRDVGAFKQGIRQGIGRAKSFGFGLLMVRPA